MVEEIVSGIVATLMAIILHELAHGVMAWVLGDSTARRAGRLTLNPLRHLDRFGSVFLPLLLAVSQFATIGHIGFMFGWAKPVPVDPMALEIGGRHDPRRLMALVAVAGPVTNFLLAFLGALALHGGVFLDFLTYFILVNLVLGLFNLLPMPPMDGGRIAVGLLPLGAARVFAKTERFGLLLVLLILFILPAALGRVGVHFDPFHDGLNAILPGAMAFVLRLAGIKNGV